MFRRLLLVSLIAAVAACSSHSASTSSNAGTGNGESSASGSSTAAPVGEQISTFATEQAAQAHCPGDEVVWMNTSSHAYHTKGSTRYGHTKHGGYGCRKEADANGYHEAGKHRARSSSM